MHSHTSDANSVSFPATVALTASFGLVLVLSVLRTKSAFAIEVWVERVPEFGSKYLILPNDPKIIQTATDMGMQIPSKSAAN